jgi:hypothetical protein
MLPQFEPAALLVCAILPAIVDDNCTVNGTSANQFSGRRKETLDMNDTYAWRVSGIFKK